MKLQGRHMTAMASNSIHPNAEQSSASLSFEKEIHRERIPPRKGQ